MKPMGKAPPRSKKNESLKREIYRTQTEASNKKPSPECTVRDQMGTGFDSAGVRELSLTDCAACGEEYSFGKGFVFNPETWEFYCPDCFRELAAEMFDEK